MRCNESYSTHCVKRNVYLLMNLSIYHRIFPNFNDEHFIVPATLASSNGRALTVSKRKHGHGASFAGPSRRWHVRNVPIGDPSICSKKVSADKATEAHHSIGRARPGHLVDHQVVDRKYPSKAVLWVG
jgi:hypothetical protein